ncbi:uncharacterized protein C11orf98 homolog isoform X2 [Lampris incognitus]|uniref:uncharacterized protein C11orf98 homolog isoform X2 n=1 Tax=Lampris incognitus TaxID=2546036 RepID=UPI0024B5FFFC|nr:uncharacterized protein C11orf98 homolog isoform X2 [Lampris incognitus]
MGAPSGKINRPKTELGKKLFKRRRVLGREKRKKNQIVGAVIDKGLTTIHHLRKRNSSPRANITLSGKKKRKLLKQLHHMQRENAGMEVEATMETKKRASTSAPSKKKKPAASTQDVEMGNIE